MKLRIIAAVILLPVLLIVLFLAPKVITAILIGLVCAISAYELMYRTGLVRHVRLVVYSVVAALLVPIWSFYGSIAVYGQIGTLAFFGLMFMEIMISHAKLKLSNITLSFFAGIILPYLLSSLARIMAMDIGRHVILVPFVAAFLSDSGAYFIGCRYGSHKLAPIISPNKSVEGLLGGLLFSVVGMLLYTLVMDLFVPCYVNYLYALIYGLLGSLAGVFGDLCFSAVKRQTGIKDYGNLIPGHGGALDRFDSMVTVAPLMEVMLTFIPLVVK